MKFTFRTIGASFLMTLAFFISSSNAQTNSDNRKDDSAVSAKSVKAQREIIKVVLENYFRGTNFSSIKLIADNLPASIQNDFPSVEGLSIQLVPASEETECPFQFHAIRVKEKSAEVSFGNCSEGLGYYLELKRGKWQIAPMKAENSNN